MTRGGTIFRVGDNGSEKRKQDRIERDNLKYDSAYYVLTLKYNEDWVGKLETLRSL